MHSLQSYLQDKLTDNNAYTFTSTYHSGQLKLYTTHITDTSDSGCRAEYIMTQIKGWPMTSDPETFRQGASAYRNARDWAKQKRDEFIRLANERQSAAQSQHHSAASEIAVTVEDSNVSSVFDEAEDLDVQRSLEALNEDMDEESQMLNRNTKRPRVGV